MSLNARRRASRPVATVLGGVLAAALLAACGSGASAPGSGFTGAPITVQINTGVGTQFGSYAGSVAAVRAAARAVNATGGIRGHELLVESCNTQLNPNQEVACARKTVGNGAVATVGSLMLTNGADYLAVLDKAGIADIASELIQPVFATAPNSYTVAFGFGSFAPCTGPQITARAGGTRIVSTVPDIPASAPLREFIELGATAQGMTYAGNVPVPTTVSDYAPIVQRIADLNPSVVVIIGGPAQIAPLLQQAALTGRRFTFCTPVGSSIGEALVAAGSAGSAAADNFYLATALPPLSAADQIPALATFTNEMAAELAAGDADADISGQKADPNQLQTWVGMQIFAQVARSIEGEVTAQSFQAALSRSTFSGMGIIPPIDFSKPVTQGMFTRIFNSTQQLEKWDPKAQHFDLVPGTQTDGARIMFGKKQ